jgi:flagellin-like hook-associated protein FlgL
VSNIGGGTEVTIRQTDANGDIENFAAAKYDLTFTNLVDAKGDAVLRQLSGATGDTVGVGDTAGPATFTVAGAGFTGTPVKHDEVLAVSTAYLKTTDPAVAARGADGEAILHSDAYTLKEASLLELDKAKEALTVVDDALAQVDFYRVQLGAVANRLDYSVQNLYTRIENQMAARSRIEDADYAVESAALARAQVLQQAGTAMLAQANASTQNVLSLLK